MLSPISWVSSCTSPWLTGTGRTWVGAKTVVRVAAAATPAITTPTAATDAPVLSEAPMNRQLRCGSDAQHRPVTEVAVDRATRDERASHPHRCRRAPARRRADSTVVASSAICCDRARQRAQPSTCRASRSATANGSSMSRRSVPSGTCRTINLLTKSGFGAPQHRPDLADADLHRLGNLRVAEPAVAEHENCRGVFRQAGRGAVSTSRLCFARDGELLRAARRRGLRGALLAILDGDGRTADGVQARMGRRNLDPGVRVVGSEGLGKALLRCDENVLGDVLGEVGDRGRCRRRCARAADTPSERTPRSRSMLAALHPSRQATRSIRSPSTR